MTEKPEYFQHKSVVAKSSLIRHLDRRNLIRARRKASVSFWVSWRGRKRERPSGVKPPSNTRACQWAFGLRKSPKGWKATIAELFSLGGARGPAVELRQEGEDQGGDGAEELLVVTEENARCFRYGEDELPVRELEEELLIEVFGE